MSLPPVDGEESVAEGEVHGRTSTHFPLPRFLRNNGHNPWKHALLEPGRNAYLDLDDSGKTEFNIAKIVDWKRVRSSIEHENQLLNHRLTWLLTSQAFLFAAFGLVLNESLVKPQSSDVSNPLAWTVLIVFGILGVFLCEAVHQSANLARIQIERLVLWWYAHYIIGEQELKTHETASDALERVRYEMEIYGFETDIRQSHPPINGIFDPRPVNQLWAAHRLPKDIQAGWFIFLAVLAWFLCERNTGPVWVKPVIAFLLLGAVYWAILHDYIVARKGLNHRRQRFGR